VRYFVRCCLSDDVVSSRLYVFAHNNLRIILTVKHGLVIHYVRLFVSGCVHVRIGPICVPSDVTEIAARYGCISERSRHRSADQTSQPDCRHEHPSPQRLWPSTHQGDNKCVPANPAKLGRLSKLHHHRIDSPYLCGCQRVRKHSTGTASAYESPKTRELPSIECYLDSGRWRSSMRLPSHNSKSRRRDSEAFGVGGNNSVRSSICADVSPRDRHQLLSVKSVSVSVAA
jgi:hypothetical protein